MFKSIIILSALIVFAIAAELPISHRSSEKQVFKTDQRSNEGFESQAVFKDELKDISHPVYKADERIEKNEGRVRIEPVRPTGPVIQQDRMLADEPMPSTDINRNDNIGMPNYGFEPIQSEVTFPGVPYAPGYNYDTGYLSSNNYDLYRDNYLTDPDTSSLGLVWGQLPNARTIVYALGRTLNWVFSSIFVLLLGSILTLGVCSYTNLCTLTFHGIGPIHEEMRSLMTPERLEKISTAADFVKNAIDKYQKIQKVTNLNNVRSRRAIYNL